MSRLTSHNHPLLLQEIIDKLKVKNIYTVEQFLEHESKYLENATNLNYKNISIIKKHICNKHASVLIYGNDLYANCVKKSRVVSTGYNNFDEILVGGFYTGKIYEICGLSSSGKSLYCQNFLLHYAQLSKQKIIYFDSKYEFSAINLKKKIESGKELILKNILVTQCNTINELISSFYKVKKLILKDSSIKFIVVDHLPGLLYQNTDPSVANGLLTSLVNITRLLTEKHYLTFIFVNSITTWKDSIVDSIDSVFSESTGCGKYWRQVPNTTLKFTHLGKGQIAIKILKSCDIEEGKCCEINLT